MPTLAVYNIEGKETGSINLPEEIFGGRVNDALIHQVITMYRANERQGNVATKERSQVSGGGKKPYRQKGTGRARAGSSRSPLWKGGGVIFGPHPRDFGYTVPKKMRQAALRECLNAKFQGEGLVCVDEMKVGSGKTKDFANVLNVLKIQGRVLALIDNMDEKTALASRNIRSVNICRTEDINAMDVLNNKKVLVTKSALEQLLKRVQ
jgi:large subunit ribosomal protein L4